MSDAMNLRPNVPWYEAYGKLAPEWIDADSAADLMEQTRSAWMAQEVQKLVEAGESAAAAERQVRASPEYSAYIKTMVEARKRANLLKARLEYIRMRNMAEQSDNATQRVQMRMAP